MKPIELVVCEGVGIAGQNVYEKVVRNPSFTSEGGFIEMFLSWTEILSLDKHVLADKDGTLRVQES